MLTIDAQIYQAFDTGKKMANNKPDRLIIFLYKSNTYNARVYKVFNNDKVPFFDLRASSIDSLTNILGTTVIEEKTAYTFEFDGNEEFFAVKKNIEIMLFKKWLDKTKNIYRDDKGSMDLAFKKIT